MSEWQLLKQKLTVSQILRTYGKQFTQIIERYSDGHNGRCALGVIMSYYGWNGKDDSQAASKLLGTLIALRYAGIDRNLLIDMNDSGFTFDEIAGFLISLVAVNLVDKLTVILLHSIFLYLEYFSI